MTCVCGCGDVCVCGSGDVCVSMVTCVAVCAGCAVRAHRGSRDEEGGGGSAGEDGVVREAELCRQSDGQVPAASSHCQSDQVTTGGKKHPTFVARH